MWRKQPQEGRQGQLQRGPGGPGTSIVPVGTALHQLEMHVGEAPEERLGSFQRPGVIKLVERLGGRLDERGHLGQHRPVDRMGHGFWPQMEHGCVGAGLTVGRTL